MRKSAKLCLYGVVIAGLVGGTAAWATTDKAVTVSVDGQSRTIHTSAATVGGALKRAHIDIAEHDAVAPAPNSKIADKGKIVVRKGRLLHLTVDGKAVDVWTTASTVDEALAALGYGSGKVIGVSRSTRLPLSATDINLITPKELTITADGKTQAVESTSATVQQALLDAGYSLGTEDIVQPALATPITADTPIVIQRVTTTPAVELEPIPFTTTSTDDPNATKGATTIVTPGKAGAQQVTYSYVYVDGVLASKTAVSSTVVTPPVAQVQKVGTKAPPAVAAPAPPASGPAVPSGDAQAIAAQLVAARGWDNSQFSCLVSLWSKESGWNVHAANGSGAYGIPQALPGSKMASAGPDWQNNATTQITWGLGYIAGRYGTPCAAWSHSQSSNWY